MKPLVFVSSTIDDLRHVRDAVRDIIEEIGFQPIMSDYSEIGYMSGGAAESACYRSVTDCQLMVLIIGNRYGAVDGEGRSVTEKEFTTFQQNGDGRLITLVSTDVMRYKKMYDENKGLKGLVVPNMVEPARVFAFIDRVSKCRQSNAIICYERTSDIRRVLKLQIADLVYRALTGEYCGYRSVMNDILSEVQTVRNAMVQGSRPSDFFLRTTRFLLDEKNGDIAKLMKKLARVDKLVASMADPANVTFANLCKACGVDVEIIPASVLTQKDSFDQYSLVEAQYFSPIQNKVPLSEEERHENMGYAWVAGMKKILMTEATLRYYEAVYASAIEDIRDGI